MIQTTVGAPVQLWQQATQTIDSLQGQVNQISSFARQAGDVNTYMNQFKNPSYYQTNACTFGNCTAAQRAARSEEHTSELQSLMRISYAVFCLKKKKKTTNQQTCTK